METKSDKKHLLEQLYKPYVTGVQHPRHGAASQRFVPGQGNPDACLMLIGEAPGKDEDEQLLPFVGRSGKLLTKILEIAGINRKDVYISNIVKYRPPNNRKPLITEIDAQKPILLKEIEIIKPTVICTLGSSSLEGLLGTNDFSITKIRGIPQLFHGIPLIPTYHPAYILRSPKELPKLYDDICKALTYCNK